MMVHGGYSVYGLKIGILVLDSEIPRIPGDIGNAATYDFPVVYKVVPGATISKVVGDTDPSVLNPFIKAARELEAEGCKAITTSCGFLASFQDVFSSAVNIPIFTSSLIQVKYVYSILPPGKKVGIITAEKDSLRLSHLEGVGIQNIPSKIVGLDGCDAFTAMRSPDPTFDPEVLRADMVKAAKELTSDGDIGAIVIECTNLPPYSADVARVTGLPVFDIVTMIHYIHMALEPKRYNY